MGKRSVPYDRICETARLPRRSGLKAVVIAKFALVFLQAHLSGTSFAKLISSSKERMSHEGSQFFCSGDDSVPGSVLGDRVRNIAYGIRQARPLRWPQA